VPDHGAPWTSAGTTWTGRAVGREASGGNPGLYRTPNPNL